MMSWKAADRHGCSVASSGYSCPYVWLRGRCTVVDLLRSPWMPVMEGTSSSSAVTAPGTSVLVAGCQSRLCRCLLSGGEGQGARECALRQECHGHCHRRQHLLSQSVPLARASAGMLASGSMLACVHGCSQLQEGIHVVRFLEDLHGDLYGDVHTAYSRCKPRGTGEALHNAEPERGVASCTTADLHASWHRHDISRAVHCLADMCSASQSDISHCGRRSNSGHVFHGSAQQSKSSFCCTRPWAPMASTMRHVNSPSAWELGSWWNRSDV